MKRVLKIFRNVLLSLLALVVLLFVLINLTPVQNYLAKQAAKMLAKKLETTVKINHVRIDFVNQAVLQGLYIADKNNDTLLYAGEAKMRITDWFFIKKEIPVLHFVGLEDAYAHLYRNADSDVWNYQFIIDAFAAPKKKKDKTQQEFELDLKKVQLDNVRFHFDDGWHGQDIDLDVGSLNLKANAIHLKDKVIDLDALSIEKAKVAIRDYKGGKPKKAKVIDGTIDTTAFNTDNWVVKLGKADLVDCEFVRDGDSRTPVERFFDPEHMRLTKLKLSAENLAINKDTLTASLTDFGGIDRSGFVITHLHGDVRVDPTLSEIKNLVLQTPNSHLTNYYAMRYPRFPAFLDYIGEVTMEAVMDSSIVDFKDIAFFAPELRKYPTKIAAKGHFLGTVADFKVDNFAFSDGTSSANGELLTMQGLPNIYGTFIHLGNGTIHTTGNEMLRYAPQMKGNPNLALERLSYIDFRGTFTGFLENFATDGTLATNLGNFKSTVEMKIPFGKGKTPLYSGTVSTTGFNLGALIRQPLVGNLAMSGDIQGNGFDPLTSQIKVKTRISSFQVNGYNYTNILADGILAKKKFTGDLLVTDSNLAAAFNGTVDFSGERPALNAKSNILYSNLQRLGISDELITLSADFDMAASGSNIDNFLGTARLYNIDLSRDKQKLDVDSVVWVATLLPDNRKEIKIESNLLAAKIVGRFDLSLLANSTQYFLAGYLPNYIHRPKGYAPDQDLDFIINTKSISGLFEILVPGLEGFDNSTMTGSLNTTSQQIDLSIQIPEGKIAGVKLRNLVLNGIGDFNQLAINGDIGEVNIGDSLLNMSANVTTTLGNDSLSFNIETTSPLNIGTASINGAGYAKGDSLFAYFEPSEFYLNNARWDIPGGNAITFANNYLAIEDLIFKNGLQSLSIQTSESGNLLANFKNLELGQLMGLAGLGYLQTDGRINGDVSVSNIFKDFNVEGILNATGVQMGKDTIGKVILKGNYSKKKGLLTMQDGSGIYLRDASLTATGTLAIDTTTNQAIRGNVKLKNAPLAWLNPVLEGYVSNLEGVLNGKIDFTGTASRPDVEGSVMIEDASLKVDYLGTTYSIPKSSVGITSTAINVGNLLLKDVYGNDAQLTGRITHNRFKNFQLGLSLASDEFELVNLQDFENDVFYGHLIADTRVSVSGPVDDVRINITKAVPVKKSQLILPLTDDGGTGTYSYISFLDVGKINSGEEKKKSKLSLSINASANPLLEVTMIMDASTGDRITASGNGNLLLEMPAGEDLRMYGNYIIEKGTYTFTFRRLFFTREFSINSGSRISFSGPVESTELDVRATYRTRASLYDLLDARELSAFRNESQSEQTDTKRLQDVLVQLNMKGKLSLPDLHFKIDLPEKRSVGTTAYAKLERLNQNEQQLFEQVASLLLIGYFLPPEGITGTSGATATTGAVNNLSQILSTSTSAQLTNIVNKVLGDKRLSVEFKYKNYNLNDGSTNDILNRNEVKLGLRRNFFNDRLIVEVGSAYDWGRPTASSASASNFNILGDFRLQYLLTPGGSLRLNTFHTSNYDALASVGNNRNIQRTGIGLSWRKSFNTLGDFFKTEKTIKEREAEKRKDPTLDSSLVRQTEG